MNNRKAGWSRPINCNKHHFFGEDEITSICGKWMYFGHDRETDTFESPDDCADCRRQLNKLKAKSGAVESKGAQS